MIRATSSTDGPPVTFNVKASGLAIYLDTFAIFELAEGDPSRRRRFIDTLHSGADLLFSVSNAVELTGPQGCSLQAVRTFLNDVGPHWFPVELNAVEVVQREGNGVGRESCLSKRFVNDYFAARMVDYPPHSGKIVDLSKDFFRLGAVLDWVGPQRESIRKGSTDIDNALIKKINDHRIEFRRDPPWLDQKFPTLQFRQDMPATFTYINLVRTLIIEGQTLKKNDGLDFCHAVMASAFASVATLDKHWKRRIESLPKPNMLARIYYQPELDEMVTAIESWLTENSHKTEARGPVQATSQPERGREREAD